MSTYSLRSKEPDTAHYAGVRFRILTGWDRNVVLQGVDDCKYMIVADIGDIVSCDELSAIAS
jgi:hypothetical protein